MTQNTKHDTFWQQAGSNIDKRLQSYFSCLLRQVVEFWILTLAAFVGFISFLFFIFLVKVTKNKKISCHFHAKCGFLYTDNKQFFRFWSLSPKNEKWNEPDNCFCILGWLLLWFSFHKKMQFVFWKFKMAANTKSKCLYSAVILAFSAFNYFLLVVSVFSALF